jgi:hypothetical protein
VQNRRKIARKVVVRGVKKRLFRARSLPQLLQFLGSYNAFCPPWARVIAEGAPARRIEPPVHARFFFKFSFSQCLTFPVVSVQSEIVP